MTNDQQSKATRASLPSQAQAVIIGGGVIGCSVTYHLSKLGWRDVLLLERKLVSSVTHGAHAHLLGCSMGMGYLEHSEGINDEWILSGRYEIDVEGTRIPAKAHLKAPYDPSGDCVRM